MREPTWDIDGWVLEDGEIMHGDAPETFWIPPREAREGLLTGDLVKLVFRYSIDDDEEPVAVDRMWVLVRGRIGTTYLGLLDNDPSAIEENEEFWSGLELPFEARHVIAIDPGDDKTRALAAAPPRRSWTRE